MPTRAALRRRIYEILEVAREGDRTSRVVDTALVLLIGANVVAVTLESVHAIGTSYHRAFHGFEILSVAVFTVEYALRVWSCVEERAREGRPLRRWAWIFRPLALADLICIAPFLVHWWAPLDLRFLRVLRLVRVFKLTRYSPAMNMLLTVLRQQGQAFGAALFIMLTLMVLAASGIYLAESHAQPEAFASIPASMWWAVATLTTVGYGDVTPVTILGKIFGAFITVLGVGMAALPAGLLASGFSREFARRERLAPLPEHAIDWLAAPEASSCPHCGKDLGRS